MVEVAQDSSKAPAELTQLLQAGAKPGVSADDAMSEAGRKILAYHFARMRFEEEKVRAGDTGEPIHDMRVATRRLRSALVLFGPYYDKQLIKPFRKALRRVADALGAVRDMDVFRQKAQEYTEKLSEADRQGMQPLLGDCQNRIDAAHKQLIETLDSQRYAHFVADFSAFVTTPGEGAAHLSDEPQPVPYLVRHIAPALIYEKYATVRAYDIGLQGASLDTLHTLRINAKRLRYTLEAFEEVLGPDAKKVINATKAMQDHLGDLQDARVAGAHMLNFVRGASEQTRTATILQYMAVREEEKLQLLNSVSQMWDMFTHPDVRRSLALAVAVV